MCPMRISASCGALRQATRSSLPYSMRAGVIRAMMLNHSIHHRAQLGVYLRLLGVPVPAEPYGPSADEQ